ncbi:magnesium citrate secondary transporter [Lunatimonas salinarum]|uniref:magnesium citrate secondary transporter n=1 Tax=Lunatimonas salinarum TaxID=1774590 RepID=UPI001AE07261|nr:magnesium citrate secondary transporter [Lunatimonas salinarum]
MKIWKNPYFLGPCVAFWANQYLEKGVGIFVPLLFSYLDDLLAMPVILGTTLQVFRWIHPAGALFRFSSMQMVVGVAYISLLFEVLLPLWSEIYTRDFWDVVCYAIGALYFCHFINIPTAK